ncbi:MAG: hypothetical protein ACTSPL_04065 [Candidatus Odinarchaeia archaeon]
MEGKAKRKYRRSTGEKNEIAIRFKESLIVRLQRLAEGSPIKWTDLARVLLTEAVEKAEHEKELTIIKKEVIK